MKARLFSLNVWDFFKGLILAVITAIITFITNELSAGSEFNTATFKRIGIAAVIAFLSYLIKNAFTNSNDQFATPEIKLST